MSAEGFRLDDPLHVDVVRGDVVESVHHLDVAVVDAGGAIVASAGDSGRSAYFRSTLKPVQAGVCMAEGWQPESDEAIAVACASHNAEPAHLEAVRSILARAGLDEQALRCPPALPLLDVEAARAGEAKPILRDCSGKHAAFLATCVARGWPLESYLDLDHPMQRAVVERVAELTGHVGALGVDGCGAVTPAAPLSRLARGFGRGLAEAPRVAGAMRAHPFLVAGTRRVCTDLMRSVPGDLVVKAGAEGLLCFASVRAGIAGAIKSRDGWSRPVAPAVMWVLERLGLLPSPVPDSLGTHARPVVLGGGRPVGRLVVRS